LSTQWRLLFRLGQARHIIASLISVSECRYVSDQKPYRAAFNYQRKRDIEAQLNKEGEADFKLPSSITPLLKQNVPRDSTGFMKNEEAREIRRRSRAGAPDMQPFETLKQNISGPTYSAMTIKPFRHEFATPVQVAVLKLLPGLAEPYSDESKERKDAVAISEKGTGKSLAFLVPAIEARQKAITMHGKLELVKQGQVNNSSLEQQINRIYTRTRVGALILTTTREEATTIANEAILLSRNHHGMETRLFVGGVSKRTQLRDWMTGRRDIVVATPGRLRDLLTNEPAMREGFMYTQTVLLISLANGLLELTFLPARH
jgi:ATP-dependent RNA helicase MSS116, mitochondrial